MRKCSWTEEEITILKQEGPNKTTKEWADFLSKKEETIKSMMRKLGISWKYTKRISNLDNEVKALWEKESPHKIAEILNIPKGSVYSLAKRLGLKILVTGRTPEKSRRAQEASAKVQRGNSKIKADSKFGQWTPVSAYIFGVLWADGFILANTAGIGLTVARKDKEWHRKLGNWFLPGIHIGEGFSKKNGKIYRSVTWNWCCVEGGKLLTEMGLLQRKSFINPPYPYVPDEYFHHFARGVQDGDGSPTETSLRWYGSPAFMEGFREQFLRLIPENRPNELMNHKSLKVLQWGAQADVERTVQFLYRDCGEWYLSRKRKGQEFLSLRELQTIWDNSKSRGPTNTEVARVLKFYRSYGFPYPITPRAKLVSTVERIQNTNHERIFRDGKVHHVKTGMTIVNMFHLGIWSAHTRENKSYLETFEDDTLLEKIIRDRYVHGKGLTPSQILTGLRNRPKGPANYPPATAKAIYDKYLPNSGNTLDPCGGYGGRILGALCSDQVKHHVSLEPATDTYKDTRTMLSVLRKTVPTVETRKTRLINTTAEEYCPLEKREFFDLVFTSPPYFDQEIYSDELNQVSSFCKTIDDYKNWIKKIVGNWIFLMKKDAHLLIQISDPSVKNQERLPIISAWKDVLNLTSLTELPSLTYEYPGGRGKRSFETILVYQKLESGHSSGKV